MVVSPPTNPKIAARGVEMAIAQPCFPVQVAHGHVAALVERNVDYVLVPNVLDAESEEGSDCVAHFCPWNQTLPFVLSSNPELEPHSAKFLAPSIHFRLGREHIKKVLAPIAKKLGVAQGAERPRG